MGYLFTELGDPGSEAGMTSVMLEINVGKQ